MTSLILALDFGGTKHTVGLAAAGAPEWLARRQIFSPPGADAEYDIATVLAAGRALLEEVPGRLLAVGVSFGGPVNFDTGVVRLSHHVPGWESRPLRELVEREFGAPARVDNDANVAALGEHTFGAGRGCDSLMYITVSTGIGGGWILGDRPWRGSEGMAGEIGHMRVDPNGPPCVCGGHGCVERLASGPSIAARVRDWLAARPEQGDILRRLAGSSSGTIDARLVAQAAAEGDELAWESLALGAHCLGVAIGATANVMNPQRFVLGGGVTKSGARYWQAVQQAARSVALPEVHFQIVPAALGDDAPLWGAVVLATQE